LLEGKENLPKVTIMIATYNQERFIGEAIESAMAQDYSNLEIVVCDDCSTDRTYEIAKQYERKDLRVKVFRNEHNLGRVGNYHHLLYDLADGEWCVMLDGDDYYIDESFISKCIYLLENQSQASTNIVACLAGFIELDVSSNMQTIRVPKGGLAKGEDAFRKFPESWMNHGSFLYKRFEAISVDGYTKDLFQADAELFLRLCLVGDIVYCDKPVYVWRLHGLNTWSAVDALGLLDDTEKLVSSVSLFATTIGFLDGSMFERLMVRHVKVSILRLGDEKSFKKRFHGLLSIVKRHPKEVLLHPRNLLISLLSVFFGQRLLNSTVDLYLWLKRKLNSFVVTDKSHA